jgi:ribosome-associated protein
VHRLNAGYMNTNSIKEKKVTDLGLQGVVALPDDDRELLDQCDVTTFRSSGKGGQHVNKTDSAVRLVHRPTGIVVISRKDRSQYMNKKECLANLRRKFEKLTTKAPPRISTKVPKSVKKKRQEVKVKTTQKKQLRKRPVTNDE